MTVFRYALFSLSIFILSCGLAFSWELPVPVKQGNTFSNHLPMMLSFTNSFPTLLNQGDFLFIDNQVLKRYNPYTKRYVWKNKQPYAFNDRAICDADLCFIADKRGVLYAYNAFSGALQWQKVLPSTIISRVLPSGEQLFVQTDNDYILSLAADSAHVRWSMHFSQPEPSLEMLAEPRWWRGYIWSVLRNGQLVGMDPDTGKVQFHEPLAQPDISLISDMPMLLDATPLAFRHLLLVSAYDSGLKAFELQNQTLREVWHLKDIQGVMAMVKDDGQVYVLDMNHGVWGINPLKGQVIWHTNIRSSLISHMVMTTDYVLLKDKDHWIYLNKKSGLDKVIN